MEVGLSRPFLGQEWRAKDLLIRETQASKTKHFTVKYVMCTSTRKHNSNRYHKTESQKSHLWEVYICSCSSHIFLFHSPTFPSIHSPVHNSSIYPSILNKKSSIQPLINLPVHLSNYPSTHWSVHSSIQSSAYPSTHPHTHSFTRPSNYLFIHLSVHPSIYSHPHLSVIHGFYFSICLF